MKLSLCLEMLFTDQPFIERLAIASRLGYRAIEFWDWRDKDLPAFAQEAARLGLTVAAISGNRLHALIDPDSRGELVEEMDQVFAVARQVNCSHIMMLSDVLTGDGSAAPGLPRTTEEKIESMVANLRTLASRAEAASVTLLLEPLNTALDHRGVFLNTSSLGVDIVRRVGSAHVKLLYDIYHMSMMGEDVLREIDKNLEWFGYFHVADLPGRHQPGTGEIDYQAVNTLLRRAEYEGFVGMEFSAHGPDEAAAKAPFQVFGIEDGSRGDKIRI